MTQRHIPIFLWRSVISWQSSDAVSYSDFPVTQRHIPIIPRRSVISGLSSDAVPYLDNLLTLRHILIPLWRVVTSRLWSDAVSYPDFLVAQRHIPLTPWRSHRQIIPWRSVTSHRHPYTPIPRTVLAWYFRAPNLASRDCTWFFHLKKFLASQSEEWPSDKKRFSGLAERFHYDFFRWRLTKVVPTIWKVVSFTWRLCG